MNPYSNDRTSTLEGVYSCIENICRRHRAIAQFDCGDAQNFGTDYKYPLAYMETINFYEENEAKNVESYAIALNLCDRQPDNGNRVDMVRTHDRLKQLLSEIKAYMEQPQHFGEDQVSAARVTVFNDYDDAKLVRLRAEFTVDVNTLVTDEPDFETLFPE